MPPQMQSPVLDEFGKGLLTTLGHGGVTLALLILGIALYVLLTPHKEVQLIREGNSAAAVSLGGIMLGLAIPLAASLSASFSVLEICLWGAVTIFSQLLVFRIIDMVLTGLPQRIKEGEMSAAALLVSAKLSAALILAAAVLG